MIPVEGKFPNRFLLVDDDDAVLEVTNKRVGAILERCNEQAMEALDEITLEAMYRENTLLYVEGQVTRGVFILCQGQVKLTRTSLEGKSFILKIAQPGHILGLNEVVGGYSHTSTAETLRSSQLAFIQSSKFLNFMKLHGDASLFVCRQLIADCASAYEVIRSIGLSECVKNKLARLLVGWSLDARCSEDFTRLKAETDP